MPTVKRKPDIALLARAAHALRVGDLMRALPATLSAGEAVAATYVVNELKKAVTSRYDALRDDLLRRVGLVGRSDGERATAYLDGWTVVFSEKRVPLSVENLRGTLSPRVVWAVLKNETHVCASCNGTGKVKTTTVDEAALAGAVEGGVVEKESVYKVEHRLSPLRPPPAVAGLLEDGDGG